MKDISRSRLLLAAIAFVLAALSLFSNAWPGSEIEHYLGELLIWAAVLEIYDGFGRASRASKLSAHLSGAFSLFMAAILVNAILFRPDALYLFVMILFLADALRYLRNILRTKRGEGTYWFDVGAFAGNLILALLMYFAEDAGRVWALSMVVSLRLVGIGINILLAKEGRIEQVHEDVLQTMGLQENQQVVAIAGKIRDEEAHSAPHDRRWIITFLIFLFAVHLGRMGLDRSFLGILSPLVATLGDAVIAIIFTYAFFAPLRLLFLNLLRKRAQRLWTWIYRVDEQHRKKIGLRALVAWWLSVRIRSEIRFTKAGYSLKTAARMGLKIGLPWAALLAAIMPVLGMSWYFDTENWASGIWDKWAAARADVWRMSVTQSSGEGFGADAFRVKPDGVRSGEDFSFVIVGDPGEGDASQQVLKDQILAVSNHAEVKFVVISSDVVYPTGALRDYEKKFWLPFKGVTKPVYAIPGNHDWYDALDGFIATFYEPAAARKAMLERVAADHKMTTTTEDAIDEMIGKSARWRSAYGVPTGYQKAPYFQIDAGGFTFITLETGVTRQIDSLQQQWLVNVLEKSKDKFVMVLLGHPFYAIGEYQGSLNPRFASLHNLLKSYHVPLVMAGDTHDLEYYLEPAENPTAKPMHHFVNGGGGAYLSIGAAMAKPGTMPTKEYAFYPSRAPLVKKITENTKWYKAPAWWWATRLDGWPFSAEWLSAMFDYNVSPFFQSFVEVKVEFSKHRVVLIPYCNDGRIRWKEITSTTGARPAGATEDDFAEWVFPMQ